MPPEEKTRTGTTQNEQQGKMKKLNTSPMEEAGNTDQDNEHRIKGRAHREKAEYHKLCGQLTNCHD